MNVKFLNPFLEAIYEVLKTETGVEAGKGDLQLDKGPYTTDDITVIIALVGSVEGMVFYSLISGDIHQFGFKNDGRRDY